MAPKCFLFLLPDFILVFVPLLCFLGHICAYIEQYCGCESVRKKHKRRTQGNINKVEEVPESINFLDRGALPIFSDQCCVSYIYLIFIAKIS